VLFAAPAFLRVPAAAPDFARAFLKHQERGWAAYSAASVFGMLTTYVLASVGFRQRPGLVEIVGAPQRTSIAIGFTWMTSLAAQALAVAD
jgi:hypothetical protein